MLAAEGSEELRELAREERVALQQRVRGRCVAARISRRLRRCATAAGRGVRCRNRRNLPSPHPAFPQVSDVRGSLVSHLLPTDDDEHRNAVVEVRVV